MDSFFGGGQNVSGHRLVAMVQSQTDATPVRQNATPMKTGRKKVGMSPGGSGIMRTPRGWGAMPGTADSDRVRTPASRGRPPGTADSSRYGSSMGGVPGSVGGIPPDDDMHEMVMEGVRAALVERADVIQTQQVCTSCLHIFRPPGVLHFNVHVAPSFRTGAVQRRARLCCVHRPSTIPPSAQTRHVSASTP